MTRRGLLQGILVAGLWNTLVGRGNAAQPRVKDMKGVSDLQNNWKMYLAAGYKAPLPTEPLKLSKDEWRKRLSREAYAVLREEATERAGTSPLNQEKREGVFACAGCDLPLFTSAMKFESGTGWPSFFTTIPGVFGTKTDYLLFLPRTEYHCMRCGGHHGHVFDDGPQPTGQRWCNNGVALKFIPKTGKA
ncbi:MAG TPA: peptide-methionine (R)-S-oxide reductase MsrB [Burkholderiales bacterium]|nr:peptide-methionine (R)-S-oxide reductase MsrB [Burkholderiales bacterium]